MFDLNASVDNWCKKVVALEIWEAQKIDELKDHLYCIIESEKALGKSNEEAFKRATESLAYEGVEDSEQATLQEEKRVVGRICALLNKIEGNKYADSPLIIVHALIWASMMLASAFVISDESSAQSVFWLLLFGWLASFMALGGTKQSAHEEWACFKRKIQKLM